MALKSHISYTIYMTEELTIKYALYRSNSSPAGVLEKLALSDASDKPRENVKIETSKNKPIFILLHGWGSNEADLPGVVSAIEQIGLEAYPWISVQAPIKLSSMYGMESYAWIENPVPENQTELDEGAKQSADALVSWINNNLQIDQEIVLLGFSQGALLVTELIKQHQNIRPNIKAGVALSGFVSQTPSLSDSQHIPTFFSYGLVDDVVPLTKLKKCADWLEDNTKAVIKSYPNLAHSIDIDVIMDIKNFLGDVL